MNFMDWSPQPREKPVHYMQNSKMMEEIQQNGFVLHAKTPMEGHYSSTFIATTDTIFQENNGHQIWLRMISNLCIKYESTNRTYISFQQIVSLCSSLAHILSWGDVKSSMKICWNFGWLWIPYQFQRNFGELSTVVDGSPFYIKQSQWKSNPPTLEIEKVEFLEINNTLTIVDFDVNWWCILLYCIHARMVSPVQEVGEIYKKYGKSKITFNLKSHER